MRQGPSTEVAPLFIGRQHRAGFRINRGEILAARLDQARRCRRDGRARDTSFTPWFMLEWQSHLARDRAAVAHTAVRRPCTGWPTRT